MVYGFKSHSSVSQIDVNANVDTEIAAENTYCERVIYSSAIRR